VNDTARVSVTVQSQGLDTRPAKVKLRDGDKVLDAKTVTLRDAEQQKVELSFQAKEPGAKYLSVVIAPLPDEPEHLRANDSEIAFVRVTDEKLKVLLIDGLPRWDDGSRKTQSGATMDWEARRPRTSPISCSKPRFAAAPRTPGARP